MPTLLPERPQQPAGADRAPNRGFWALRDIPTALWLLILVAVVLVHRSLPVAGWLMLHLLLLGAVTHAILVWSQYFSFALLRAAPSVSDRRTQSWRLALSNAGALAVLLGVVLGIWPVTLVGAAALIVAVLWHAVSLVLRARGSLPGLFGRTIRYYIVAAAMLAVGVALGAWLARDHSDHDLVLAHALLNVFGWIGLTVAGTLVTLWPTILRTRADAHAPVGAARALPVLAGGVLIAAAGAAAGLMPVVALGLLGYATGLGIIAVSLWRAARVSPPRSFAALSVAAGFLWWAGCLVTLTVVAILSSIPGILPAHVAAAHEHAGAAAAMAGSMAVQNALDTVAPFLAAGFAAQVLIGALSYLVPVVLGGGPTPVRVGTAAFDRAGSLRIAAANVALLVCVLPVSSVMRVAASVLYLVAAAAFLPIMFAAMRAQARAKRRGAAPGGHGAAPGRGPIEPEGERPRGHRAGQAIAGLIAVIMVVAGAAAFDPVSLGWSAVPAAAGDAPVKVVTVHAANMRFTPSRIEVPAGTHLKIALTNTDTGQVHDLVFANGTGGTRLAPGASETIDVGVITANLEGWCSIIGHRQAGMTLTVVATGSVPAPAPSASGSMPGMGAMPGNTGSGSAGIDLSAAPGAGFHPYDAELPPLEPANGPVTRHITMTVADRTVEVAPGVTQTLWEYNGTAPGPVLHGRVGDTFVVTLVNHSDMGHSIDFHAGELAPDEPMRTIAPGQSLTYRFTAGHSGIWMYHCSTMPMSAHIASGMYGAVVVEPKDLAAVARSYVLVQGEYYLGDHQGGSVDTAKLVAGTPDLVVFNGYANQYDHAPLTAVVGERVRVWVLDAGVERASSFHIVGGQFDTVWSEGRYLVDHATDTGSQALGLQPAQGGFVELAFPEAGHYPFVSHYMLDAERGAHGIFDVTAAAG
ncbi:multicopper oxidase domain-containing protein [Microbacterium panaciterrae]|uniref:Copper-containing nitrite reductase n=1 Tax=Microbacterium panaciterrae TaxID=985759 RepID=A0ABP8P225_9MICO